MPSRSNGKNISIHFTEDELSLLDDFEEYRKQNYSNRSVWVKQHMKKALTENKRQLAFRWHENLSDIRRSRRDAQDSCTQTANEGGRGHRRDDSRKIQPEEVTWITFLIKDTGHQLSSISTSSGQRFIQLTQTCIGHSFCNETTSPRRFVFEEKPTGSMERCHQRFVWRIQCI